MRTEIIQHRYNKELDKFEKINTGLFYEKCGTEGVYDFTIYPNEETDEYVAIIRRYEDYDAETDATFWNNEADEVIEGDESYIKYSGDLD